METTKIKKTAAYLLIALLGLVLVFHLLVISSVIPYTIVWAGKLKSKEEMYVFEAVSILLNLLLLLALMVKAERIKVRISPRLINGILWFFCVAFVLNTIGNLFAENNIEKFIATPLTLISAVLLFIVVRKK